MKVISIISRKGGVGKTETAHALGAGLIIKGYKVLYIDLDSQANLTFSLGAAPSRNALDLLSGKIDLSIAIYGSDQGDYIGASESLASADIVLSGSGKEYLLKRALVGADNYDYVIIDTPAALGILTVNALVASDEVVIPVQADAFSIQGLGQLDKAIASIKEKCNKRLSINGILITRYNGRAVLSRDMQTNLEAAAQKLNTRVYKKPIREGIAVKEAQACRQDIFTYSLKSNPAQDYKAFVEEFLGE